MVWHLDAYSTPSRHRRDDADSQSRQAECDIIFKVANLADAHPLFGHNLKECDSWSHVCDTVLYPDAILPKSLHNSPLVVLLLADVDIVNVGLDVGKQV